MTKKDDILHICNMFYSLDNCNTSDEAGILIEEIAKQARLRNITLTMLPNEIAMAFVRYMNSIVMLYISVKRARKIFKDLKLKEDNTSD